MEDLSYLNYSHDSICEIESFFHASPHHFNVGDVLVPQPPAKRNFSCSAGLVYLTDAPAPHYCIDVIAKEDGWFVYRVEPLSDVHPGLAQDLVCERARVLECLGLASSFQDDSQAIMSRLYQERRTKILPKPRRLELGWPSVL